MMSGSCSVTGTSGSINSSRSTGLVARSIGGMAGAVTWHNWWHDPATVFQAVQAAGTLLIPIVAAVYGLDQQWQKESQEKEERLQRCEAHNLHYGAVFRRREPVEGVITALDLLNVDRARKKLQGLWDCITNDFNRGMLPGQIYHHESLFWRGINYMRLVEPLECANWYYMRDKRGAHAKSTYFCYPGHEEVQRRIRHEMACRRQGITPVIEPIDLEVFSFGSMRPTRFIMLEAELTRRALHLRRLEVEHLKAEEEVLEAQRLALAEVQREYRARNPAGGEATLDTTSPHGPHAVMTAEELRQTRQLNTCVEALRHHRKDIIAAAASNGLESASYDSYNG